MTHRLLALTFTLSMASALSAQGPARIYTRPAVPPREALERLNLKMAWRVYLPVVGYRDGIHDLVILENQVLVLMRHGVTVSLDPITGAIQWRRLVGRSFSVTRPLEVDSDFVYVVNYGLRYALRRTTGELVGEAIPIAHGGVLTVAEGLQTRHEDIVYTVRLDRSLTAERADIGFLLWRLSLPGRMLRWPDVTNADLFIAPEGAGLFRINRSTGEIVWNNPEPVRFLAANPKFVYAIDRTGRLLVLDYVRGTRLSVYDTTEFVVPINNDVTDRIFLGSDDGLLVCLHDREYVRPLRNKGEGIPTKTIKRRPDLEGPGEGEIPAPVRGKEEMPEKVRGKEEDKRP
jgi:outer membrane protein assembly factor BamB